MKRFLLLSVLFFSALVFSQKKADLLTYFETGNGNQSANYQEAISYYKKLASAFPSIEMREMGQTDSGEPLHLVIFNPARQFDFPQAHLNKAVILVNNGIHAGEPDGIDATMMLFRDLATGKLKAPANTIVATIPVYNIGGALNRNSTTRVNQEGPEEYGFRGNARNYDLNRDFMKCDAQNTKSFIEIYQLLDPELVIDNHVSDGADYQYVLTYIMTQQNKLGPELGHYLDTDFTPAIRADLKKKKIESTPYVNVWGGTPDQGFVQFFESPRYLTGYTSLFNSMGFVVETHMLKKYSQRVKVTYEFMASAINLADLNVEKIKSLRNANAANFRAGAIYPVSWEIDSTKVDRINFLGYEGDYRSSAVTDGKRLYYDRKKPYSKEINYYKEYKPSRHVKIPVAYVIPRGYGNIADLLKKNGVEIFVLDRDTILECESYRIADYKTAASAYEGHYPHRNTRVNTSVVRQQFRKGDFLVPTDQHGVKYIVEALEPEATDSFFNWNFFDSILQQKEGYSDYVFEDLAEKILIEHPELRRQLDEKRNTDKAFAKDPEAQLDWVYRNSVYYEKAHLQYPVYRLMR
ncbi:MAG: hypothetical protein EOO51_09650 [Flavobacterium sp.]|nr:MAG: hypothetical protein EOO51_09650 [Flavobacterium sp.]